MSSEGRQPDIYFVPTPDRVIQEMLRITHASAGDLIYDLGCGDGRILIAAATQCGAQGLGIDIDPELLSIARLRVAATGLDSRVRFDRLDFFATNLSPASIITLYLLDSINIRLRPKIFAECRPGTKIVSYSFEMGDWEADEHTPIAANGVSLWIVPANVSGTWRVVTPSVAHDLTEIRLRQKYQKLSGELIFKNRVLPITAGRVTGRQFEIFTADAAWQITGQIDGYGPQITLTVGSEKTVWEGTLHPGTELSLES